MTISLFCIKFHCFEASIGWVGSDLLVDVFSDIVIIVGVILGCVQGTWKI